MAYVNFLHDRPGPANQRIFGYVSVAETRWNRKERHLVLIFIQKGKVVMSHCVRGWRGARLESNDDKLVTPPMRGGGSQGEVPNKYAVPPLPSSLSGTVQVPLSNVTIAIGTRELLVSLSVSGLGKYNKKAVTKRKKEDPKSLTFASIKRGRKSGVDADFSSSSRQRRRRRRH